MNAQELISSKAEPVSPECSSGDALALMYKYSVDHLPVVDKGKYIGLISCNELIDAEDVLKPVGSFEFTTENAYVDSALHIFEVVKLAIELNLTLIPVVMEENEYLGAITLQSLVSNFADIASINDPGGIFTLLMPIRDYSLSEVARIVETNDARILTCYIVTIPDEGMLELTVKVDKSDLTTIISTLERYEYQIKNTFQESVYYDNLKDRFESLMKYLDI
ncbi:MAG: CBS domain-containing protein [Chitinophagales bacterium]|nr:CBS domain-containing protein [Chitinophagales bacterium]